MVVSCWILAFLSVLERRYWTVLNKLGATMFMIYQCDFIAQKLSMSEERYSYEIMVQLNAEENDHSYLKHLEFNNI